MARYLLCHRHQPRECGIAFAAFKGHQSPLRHQAALASSCHTGGHEIWWTVQADSQADAARLPPSYAAHRTTITRVGEAQTHDRHERRDRDDDDNRRCRRFSRQLLPRFAALDRRCAGHGEGPGLQSSMTTIRT